MKMKSSYYRFFCMTRNLVVCMLSLLISGCAALYVDRSERTICVDSTPQGAYVWDATGKKLLGQTPLQIQLKPRDYRLHRLFITKPDYHDETVQTYDGLAGLGLGMLDAVLVVPFFVDMITLTPCYGKYEDTSFPIVLTPTSIPRPGAVVHQVHQQDAARAQAMANAAQATSQAITQGANAFSAAMTQQQPAIQPVAVSNPAVGSMQSAGGAASTGPKICPACFGSTKCRPCNGTGKNPTKKYAQGHLYDSAIPENCRPCNGTGNCLTCGGKGHL